MRGVTGFMLLLPGFLPSYIYAMYSIKKSLTTRMEREILSKPGSPKAVCKKHERAYVVDVGCPYCEE